MRLLDKFSETDQVAPVKVALGDGDLTQASGLAHSIKGVASNLSLNKLAEAALRLELCLKEGQDHSQAFTMLEEVYKKTADYLAEL